MLPVSTADTQILYSLAQLRLLVKAFYKVGFLPPPNVESNLTHNHTELHSFQRPAIYSISSYPQPGEIEIFIPSLQTWEVKYRKWESLVRANGRGWHGAKT